MGAAKKILNRADRRRLKSQGEVLNPQACLDELSQLMRRGELKNAKKLYQRAGRDYADYADVLNQVALHALHFKVMDEAQKLIKLAISNDPLQANYFNTYGLIHFEKGDFKTAQEKYEASLELDPNFEPALNNLGDLFQEQEDYTKAIESYEQSLQIDLDGIYALNKLGEVLLKQGRPEKALEKLNQVLKLQPSRISARCLQLIAYSEAGLKKEEKELLSFSDTVMQKRYDPKDMAEYNSKIVKYINEHKSLTTDPEGVSTTVGQQTIGNLFADNNQLMTELKEFIMANVELYRAQAIKLDHVQSRTLPLEYDVVGWGVSLNTSGYQAPHVHFGGWLSGVYYLQIPESINDDNQEGWIKFGPGPEIYYKKGQQQELLVKPKEGLLVMFPSYMWHQTLPFKDDENRVSFAFDVIPR